VTPEAFPSCLKVCLLSQLSKDSRVPEELSILDSGGGVSRLELLLAVFCL
jgi:hypothetical protein